MSARFRVKRRRWIFLVTVASIVGVAGFVAVSRPSTPDLPTAEVSRGEFVDALEVRGEIRPVKSVVLAAPMQAGELQIVRLARSGTVVKAGEVIARFDGTTPRRTAQEKTSELRQTEAEIEQVRSQGRIADEQNRTALMKAGYDVDRARLDLGHEELVARLDYERAKLALEDAEQRLREAEQKTTADRAAAAADAASKGRKRDKVRDDLARAERALAALELRAPVDGTLHILPNFRAGGPFGGEQEFREGDRAWAGAAIAELPDLSAVLLTARLDEADRGRLQPGQSATVRVDAIPDREFRATVADISVLARVDFSSGWPPSRNFDLKLRLENPEPRLRPGMSATARIAVGRLVDVLLAPAEAVFIVDGRPTVYRLAGSDFERVSIQIAKRGRDRVAIAAFAEGFGGPDEAKRSRAAGVRAGDRLALRKPAADP